jgi:hypothetical protein
MYNKIKKHESCKVAGNIMHKSQETVQAYAKMDEEM